MFDLCLQISKVAVDIKIICKYAIDSFATSVILAHNHPSGTLIASDADRQITKKVKEALKLFEVNLLDHLIITANDYFSFGDEGFLN